jgi:methyltransferase family protein
VARDGWTERAYADPDAYLTHRAHAVTHVGPLLGAGDTLLDLACGDAAFAEFLPAAVRYLGVDSDAAMADAGRARGHEIVVADLNAYVPAEPVEVTTCFRAVYYAHERRAFFRRVVGYTSKKFVFDLNPRQYDLESVIADLRAVGFADVAVRPFFSPQRIALPSALRRGLEALEGVGPIARALLRKRFTYICAAVPAEASSSKRGDRVGKLSKPFDDRIGT